MARRAATVGAAVLVGAALGGPASAGAAVGGAAHARTAVSDAAHAGAAVVTPKAKPVRCAKGRVARRVRVTIKVRRRYRSTTGRMRVRTVHRKVWRTRCVAPPRRRTTAPPATTPPTTSTPATGAPSTGTPPAATTPGTPPPGPVTPPGPDCSGSNVSMSLREFSVSPTRDCVAAGSVNVDVLNFGEDPHNLALRPATGGVAAWILPGPGANSELASGGNLHQTVAIPAGRWVVYCSLPGHEALGMKAELEAR
jgi:hypothetical protein